MRISNPVLFLMIVGFMVFGGIIGGCINQMQREAEVQDAWDQVTVVADGTLVANPAYYAEHPEQLAKANSVRIIDNRRAAMEAAWRE